MKNEQSKGIGLHQNAEGTSDLSVLASSIQTEGYAFLSNKKARGVRRILIAFNRIRSRNSDAVCLNHPSCSVTGVSTAFNFIETDVESSTSTAGFAVSIAGTQSHITLGNQIARSRKEAIHLEGGQKNGIVAFNIAESCLETGIQALQGKEGSGGSLIIAGNMLNHERKNSRFSGINIVSDSNGALGPNIIVGNVIQNFDSGIRLGANRIQSVSANVALNCETAISVSHGASTSGAVLASGCKILAAGAAGSFIDSVQAEDQPTQILVKVGKGTCGTTLREWQCRWAFSHLGAGMQTFETVTLPDFLRGELTIAAKDGSAGINGFWVTANLSWDGSSLKIGEQFNHSPGSVGNIQLEAKQKKLCVSFSSNKALKISAIFFFGPGRWYVS